jgi:hypothetical protein
MRTTINVPDDLLKQAKIKAVEEGISLKQLFIRSLERELSEHADQPKEKKMEIRDLLKRGSEANLSATRSGFEGYNGPTH